MSKNKNDSCEIMLVDSSDKEKGYADKITVHKNRLLHRAFSLIIIDSNEITLDSMMLLQKRQKNKYHSAQLWTNICCSHFRKEDKNKAIEEVVIGRLKEETNIAVDNINFLYKFHYNQQVPAKDVLYENEIDYVFLSILKNQEVGNFNKDEVAEIKSFKMIELIDDIKYNPNNYSIWFRMIIDNLKTKVGQKIV
jgi:isopentenyl-diphosphate delta-isomerase